MTLFSRFLGFYLKLPPVQSRKVLLIEDIKIPTKDGIGLLTDHYIPKKSKNAPLVLVRTPYGRKSFFGVVYGRLVAERGYQVLVQSCRGTFGSGGEFFPYKYEREDGLATIEWMKQQEWYPGSFATLGGSYMGFTQWAIANVAGSDLKTIAPTITASEFNSMAYPNGSFSFQSRLDWVVLIITQEKLNRFQRGKNSKVIERAYNHLPILEIPKSFFGKDVSYWGLFLDKDKNFAFWDSIGVHKEVSKVKVPVCMVSGWYDIFLPWQLKDYQTLCDHDNQPYLTIGPWSHSQIRGLGTGLAESILWFDRYLKNSSKYPRNNPVKIFIMGANVWYEFQHFPPMDSKVQTWFLQPEGKLSNTSSIDSLPDKYDYDPHDPTPNIGGTLLQDGAGPQDNKNLESRKDVLTYTSQPLESSLKVIGSVNVELYINSSLDHTDFFARLCVVDQKGKSTNICDNIIRLQPENFQSKENEYVKIGFDLWPTAFQFKKGQRMRLQVSSGAHPRFMRNLGTPEPIAIATTMKIAHQTVFHDKNRPSCIKLPVIS